MARPTKYKSDFVAQAVELCKQGATDRELADFFKVSQSTLKLWKVKHPEFSDALKLSKDIADRRVEETLYHKAVGYSHEDVHISNFQGDITVTPIIKHYPPDTTAAIFWLKNRKPGEWRDVKAQEISGADGKEIKSLTLEFVPVEQEEERTIN